MSSESALEAEELENVPLVRMEDVQPDRSVEYVHKICEDEVLETYVIDEGDCEECVVDNEDSNIGSMVSIKSEDAPCEDDAELIIPEVLDPLKMPLINNKPQPTSHVVELSKQSGSDSWPTLEILPGGVINLAEKVETSPDSLLADQNNTENNGEMMYACAKCSQRFKYLFCLVKHVRWHEEENRRFKTQDLAKLSTIEKKMAELERRSNEFDKNFGNQKKTNEPNKAKPKPRAKQKHVCLHSNKKKVVSMSISKSEVRRIPKKS